MKNTVNYMVLKTGRSMFDVCRVYGLAQILNIVAEQQGQVSIARRIRIEDHGPYYQVCGPKVQTGVGSALRRSPSWNSLFDFEGERGWDAILRTLRKKPKALKERQNLICRCFSNEIEHLLSKYRTLHDAHIISKQSLSVKEKDQFVTLPLSIDPTAAKGVKRPVRRGYEEGWQTYVPVYDFALAALGGAHFVRWIWVENKRVVGITPAPKSMTFQSHLEIRRWLEGKRVNGADVITALAHYATLLAEELRKRKEKAGVSTYADRYSSLVYNAITQSGQTWKPTSSGLFPLEFHYRVMQRDLAAAEKIFGVWLTLFHVGFGNRADIAFALADFIAAPSLRNWERYVSVHLRHRMNDEITIDYPQKIIREVMCHVETA